MVNLQLFPYNNSMKNQPPITKVLAENIKLRRNELNLSQEKLSELMNVSRLSIGLIETEKRWVSPDMLEKLSKALQCSESELFNRKL